MSSLPLKEHVQGLEMSCSGGMRTTGAWRSEFDEFSVNGWLLMGGRGERTVGVRNWGLTLASIPTPDGEGWGLSVGRCVAAPSTMVMLENLAGLMLHMMQQGARHSLL
jgi:hypothetical protein